MGWPGDGLCYCANKDQSREIFKQVDSETVCVLWSKRSQQKDKHFAVLGSRWPTIFAF